MPTASQLPAAPGSPNQNSAATSRPNSSNVSPVPSWRLSAGRSLTAGPIARMAVPIPVAIPRQTVAMPWPTPPSAFASPEGPSGGRVGVRVLGFLLPLLLEAL